MVKRAQPQLSDAFVSGPLAGLDGQQTAGRDLITRQGCAGVNCVIMKAWSTHAPWGPARVKDIDKVILAAHVNADELQEELQMQTWNLGLLKKSACKKQLQLPH